MGKASSAKKVARAARAGGSRRPGQRRAIGFPVLIFLIVALGSSLVLFARSSRDANASPRAGVPPPQGEGEHWHAAYGVSECGEFRYNTEGTFLNDVGQDALGIHTHGDGVIHIHPFIDSAGGRNARMRIWFDQVNLEVGDDKVTFPDGTTWQEGETTCTVDDEEVPAQIVIARWNDAQDAADGERPSQVFTDDFGSIRFQVDREYYTIALVPEGELEDIPVRPDIVENLNNLSDVPDTPESRDTDATATTTAGESDGSSTTATSTGEPGDATSTTAGDAPSTTAGDATTTTAAG